MTETVATVVFVVLALVFLSMFAVIMGVQNFAINEQAAAAASPQNPSALLTASGVIPNVYYPGVPGLEANGGRFDYWVSQTATWTYTTYNNYQVQYTYQYPVSVPYTYYYQVPSQDSSSYSYQVPQNNQQTGTYTTTHPVQTQESYTYYTQQSRQDVYETPSSLSKTYDDIQYIQGYVTVNIPTFGCPTHKGCPPRDWTYTAYQLQQETLTDTTWTTYSFPSTYTAPAGTVTVRGTYTIYTSVQTQETFTRTESLPYTYTWTTYQNYRTCYTYTYYINTEGTAPYTYYTSIQKTYTYQVPVNSQQQGVFYTNETVINNGKYEVVQVPHYYTYYNTTFVTETGTYYVPEQVTGQAPVTVSNPQSNTVCYYDSYPVQHSATAYQTYTQSYTQSVWQLVPHIYSYSYEKTIFQTYTFMDVEAVAQYSYVTLSKAVAYTAKKHCGCVIMSGYPENIPVIDEQVTPVTLSVTAWNQYYYTLLYGVAHTVNYDVTTTGYNQVPYSYETTQFTTKTDTRYYPVFTTYSETAYNTEYQPKTGYYWDSSPVQNSAQYYKTSQVFNEYTYWNATITNTGTSPIAVVSVVYQGPDGTYTVPLNSQPSWSAGSWLVNDGWQPPPSWSGWQSWSSTGTPLSSGYYGYQWGGSGGSGFPFATTGSFTSYGVVLLPKQVLAVPFAPRFEVGFVLSDGSVFWVS